MKKIFVYLLLITILLIPTFSGMVRSGIFSTQDFHFFRLFEFDKCVETLQLPCRWAPDAGLGYGEPLFNFYTQLPYVFGEIFHLIGFQLVDSLKIIFALSLVLSGITMYFLARRIWKSDLAGLVSAVFYVYAPYRAVDVWVRGALPEALSFIFFPLIILFFERIIENGKKKDFVFLSLSIAGTLLTHNLSLILFTPFIAIWGIYRLVSLKRYKVIGGLLLSLLGALLLSGFYILPVIFESRYINLEAATTTGYFDFRAHFTTLYQTFLSRYWGYGGSTWGEEDGVNLSLGIAQWVIPLVVLVVAAVRRKFEIVKAAGLFTLIGLVCLFFTHNKSAFIWELLNFLKYIQFPWRFLGPAVFSFSLAAGAISIVFEGKKKFIVTIIAITAVIASTFMFFKEDIWYGYTDADLTTGNLLIEQTRASIGDYWPNFGHEIPNDPATGEFINYFPGWKVKSGDSFIDAVPNELGLISSKDAVFMNTPVRTVGNMISLVGILGYMFLLLPRFKKR